MSSDTDPASGPSEPRHAVRNHEAHAAIARSVQMPPREPPPVPLRLRAEAEGYFAGAMHAYAAGDLAGARLSLLAVAGIGAPETAPAAMVFLGVIACRQREFAQGYMWLARASAGPDEHWALVADEELRRMG